jgi:hypothetical protein
VIDLRLMSKGTPYWSRPDVGITRDDIRADARRLRVTVHSVGAVDAPPSRVLVRDSTGKVLASARVPALRAPLDLRPSAATAILTLPAGADLAGSTVSIELVGGGKEITLRNNAVRF